MCRGKDGYETGIILLDAHAGTNGFSPYLLGFGEKIKGTISCLVGGQPGGPVGSDGDNDKFPPVQNCHSVKNFKGRLLSNEIGNLEILKS